MQRSRVRTLATAVACSVVLASCSTAAPTTTDPLAGYQHIGTSPSWAVWFTTLPGLVSKSDVAAAGTITKVVKVDNFGSDPASGLLQTTYEFKLDRILLGDDRTVAGGSILVTQTGGIDTNSKIVLDVHDDPRFEVGDTAVLFLTRVGEGLYAVQGGPSGRFSVKDGIVSAVVPDGVPIKGVALSEFAAQVRR